MTSDSEISIVLTRKTDVETWRKTWEKCPWATFFESPEWAGIFKNIFGDTYELHPIEFGFSDGVVAIVPGVSGMRIRGKVKMLECSPGGTYGGPISADTLHNEHLILLISEILLKFPNITFRLNPYLLSGLDASGLHDEDFTQVIDLQLPEEKLASLFRKKRVATYAKKARDSGFYIDKAPDEHLGKFHELYVASTSRWSDIARLYSLAFFRDLVACPMCDFIGCYSSEGELAGGGLFVRNSDHVISWLPVIHPEYLKKHLFELFYHDIIFHYRNLGLKYFDFNPSGGNDGVVRFKDKFQPERMPAPVVSGKTLLIKAADTLNKLGKRHG